MQWQALLLDLEASATGVRDQFSANAGPRRASWLVSKAGWSPPHTHPADDDRHILHDVEMEIAAKAAANLADLSTLELSRPSDSPSCFAHGSGQ